MKTAIVTTTINFPSFLLEYKENFDAWKVLPPKNGDALNFIVVGDNKTPIHSEQFFTWLGQEYAYDWVEYWAPDKQKAWLETFYPKKDLSMVIPENDMRRRNFGYLRALQWGADVIVTIDDDNYPFVYSKNKIVNPCSILELMPFLEVPGGSIYSRGYPLHKYFSDDLANGFMYDLPVGFCQKESSPKVVLNMGLWMGKPDVDSFTNLNYKNLYSNGTSSNQYGNLSVIILDIHA